MFYLSCSPFICEPTFENRYVEKADVVAVVAPGCLHADRRDPETKLRTTTCYRTYRNRGWCVLEIFASFLSREKIHPVLLITSAEGEPEWMSSTDVVKLAVGTCDFTCCQRNHKFGDKIVPCDRGITRTILEKLIESKVRRFFETADIKFARLFHCMTPWWTRSRNVVTPSVRCNSLASLKEQLKWDDSIDGRNHDTPWIDRCGISILLYSIVLNELNVVNEILNSTFKNSQSRLLAWRFPKEGVVEIGVTGHSTCLIAAMCSASTEIVVALLDAGANPKDTDIVGYDGVMLGCVCGQIKNIQTLLSRVSNWNINRVDATFGYTALHVTVFNGQQDLGLVKYLVEKLGADVFAVSKNGATILSSACSNEDINPKIVRYLLLKQGVDANHQVTSQTSKWKVLRSAARLGVRSRITRSKLMRRLAESGGLTALHYAARRGDIEIVELLMKHGAKPFIKNDLGRDVFSYCAAFPEIKSAMKRVKRQLGRAQGVRTKQTHDFTLQRRLTTTSEIEYDMYLISLSSMLSLFGSQSDRQKNSHLCHQDLLEKEKLTRFEDLPLGSFVMFISHQWNGFDHPDPHGRQIQVLLRVLCDLRDGVYKTETDAIHVLLYKQNTVTTSSEWSELLTNAYIWYDWFSQPQPSRGSSKDEITKLSQDLISALNSVAAYVERADTLVILTPSSVHADNVDKKTRRKMYTCYRTWRQRGFCVLELFASFLSRRSTHPVLLIRTDLNAPGWISPLESQNLAVGECDFTCCETNHLGHRGNTKMECVRPSVYTTLRRMISAKATFLLKIKSAVYARWVKVFAHRWLRALLEETHPFGVSNVENVSVLKKMLGYALSFPPSFFGFAFSVLFSNTHFITPTTQMGRKHRW